MQGPTVKAENIPQRQREQLAAPLLKMVRKAFEDPQICKEFQIWQQARKNKGGSDERIRMETGAATQ